MNLSPVPREQASEAFERPDGTTLTVVNRALAAVASLLPDVDLPPRKSEGYFSGSPCPWNGASAIAPSPIPPSRC